MMKDAIGKKGSKLDGSCRSPRRVGIVDLGTMGIVTVESSRGRKTIARSSGVRLYTHKSTSIAVYPSARPSRQKSERSEGRMSSRSGS